jgi:hypothetical protein
VSTVWFTEGKKFCTGFFSLLDGDSQTLKKGKKWQLACQHRQSSWSSASVIPPARAVVALLSRGRRCFPSSDIESTVDDVFFFFFVLSVTASFFNAMMGPVVVVTSMVACASSFAGPPPSRASLLGAKVGGGALSTSFAVGGISITTAFFAGRTVVMGSWSTTSLASSGHCPGSLLMIRGSTALLRVEVGGDVGGKHSGGCSSCCG